MTDTNNIKAADSHFAGNIFLFIMEAMQKHKNAVDEEIVMRYQQAQTTDAQYKAGVDQWKTDAAKLPDAGFVQHHGGEYNMNTNGVAMTTGCTIATGGIIAVAAYALSGVIASLGLSAAATFWCGVGFVILAMVAVLVGILVELKKGCDNGSNFTDYVAPRDEYDSNKQAAASNKVQTDQTEVQKIQGNLNQIMQQYIGPANDMKTQDANMIQAAMQWYKAMMWTQGAA